MSDLTNIEVRRLYGTRHLNMVGKGIEFGAYDRPLFSPDTCDVDFADYYTTQELKDFAARDGAHVPTIVDVRYVIKGVAFAETISTKYDFVIASHVVEHIPDVVRWLQNMEKILNDNGKLFLVVPDKRFTFDIVRPLSTLGKVLGNFVEKRESPRFEDVFDTIDLYRGVSSQGIWNQTENAESSLPRFAPNPALEIAQDYYERRDASVHSHVYTFDSLRRIIGQLRELSLIKLHEEAAYDVYRPYNEFYVVLQKRSE